MSASKNKDDFTDCIQGTSHEVFKNNEITTKVKESKLGSYREENSTSVKLSREKQSLMSLQ